MPTKDNGTRPMKTPGSTEHEVSAALLGSELTLHPCAEAFPPVSAGVYAELVADIQRNGEQEPIIVDAGNRIVDGVHRYRACINLGIEAVIERRELSDPEAWAISISRNLIRRHLSETPRAAMCATLRKSANLPVTQATLAATFNVSERLVRSAERVLEANPDLFERLKADELTVHAAEQTLSLPPDQREDAIERLKRGDVATARARLKVKPARTSQATSRTTWRKKQAQPWHAAYSPLFAAPDELPQLLIDHPLSPEHLKKLSEALKQATLLI